MLLFHGIYAGALPSDNEYGTTQLEFARIIGMLQAAGYTAVSLANYLHFIRREPATLPPRPILITFDDGRLDSYVGADDVLRVTNSRATMFIITDKPTTDAFFMRWAEIAASQASGRWDIQLHADKAHVTIPVGARADGTPISAPFLANRLYDPSAYPSAPGQLEAYTDWKARAENDIVHGLDLLRKNVPGYTQLTMAVPYGDYGQLSSNDPAIAPELRLFLGMRFQAWFTQPNDHP